MSFLATSKTIKFIVITTTLLFILIIFLMILSMVKSNTNTQQVNISITIKELIGDKKYKKANYIFLWEDFNKTLTDDHQKIVMIYGYKEDKTKTSIENEVLKMLFLDHGPILKTETDSIEIKEFNSKMAGYMGFYSDSRVFHVSEDGQINAGDIIDNSRSNKISEPIRNPKPGS